MTHFICKTCGNQFAETAVEPKSCPICEDERQYTGWQGQQWTTLAALQADYKNVIKDEEPNLTGIGMSPNFSIGQRAQLVQSPGGNVLWECVSLIDDDTIEAINRLGGIQAIAISHCHYYSSMIEWARAFDAPIYLHEANRKWVMRPDERVEFWGGETKALWGGISLIRCGGHFSGSTVLHWPAGAGGNGVLLTGDTIMVVQDRRYVSFMYSYPNLVPLPAREVRRVVAAVDGYAYDRIYGAWWDRVVSEDAKAAVSRSVERYIQAISD
jgi:glyoxylase-like metal-dependent hydrolase (beta-lactamase superfamily II)